jgi:two-component system sensor histidine kinase ChiS
MKEQIFLYLFKEMSGEIYQKILYFISFLFVAAYFLFLHSLYFKILNKWIVRFFIYSSISLSILVLIIRTKYQLPFVSPLLVYEIIAILAVVYVMYMYVKLIKQKQERILFEICGVFCFLASVVIYIVVDRMNNDTLIIMPIGLTIYIIFQTFILSDNYSRSIEARNRQLMKINKLKDDFLANTSHELRTPLHGISGIAESLCNDPSVKASFFLKNNLNYIITSARRLTNLVNDILDFSKMRHNDLILNLQPLDIVQLTNSVLPNFVSSATKKGIVLKTDFSNNLPMVMADEDRLIQILFNIVDNAIKFTDSGSVTVAEKQIGNEMVIQIIDTGIGIDEKDCSRIFDAFEQSGSQQTDYRGGTGLGLSITKKLVELHKGKISLSSKYGIGSIFTITLPIVETTRSEQEKMAESVVHHAFIIENENNTVNTDNDKYISTEITTNQKNRVVLAIDDEPINLQIVKNHLQPLGMKVIAADNGNNILDLVNKYNPSLILLDIMMPGMNGYECCKVIRKSYTIAEMPVVFISAKNRISDLVLGFEVGGNDYVLKPFLREELIARVEGQISQRDAVDAIKEIARLKGELADRLIEEVQLKQVQERLTRLLHSVDDGLIVTNDEGEIVFANTIIINMLGYTEDRTIAGRDLTCLLHFDARQNNLLTAKLSRQKYTPVLFSHVNGSSVELSVKRTTLTISDEQLIIFVIRPPVMLQDTSKMSEWIFAELEKNQERIVELEEISAECIAANKKLMEHLTFSKVTKEDPFTLANRIMIDSVALWKEATKKEKWDFAEASGLWKVHPDEDGWQRTATLDKYLDFRKMPKFPRWNTVIESARFVVKEARKRKCESEKIMDIERNVEELEGVLKGRVVACEN